MRKTRAFTLIELLIVFMIISILAALLMAGVMAAMANASYNAAEAQLQLVDQALRAYRSDRGDYPLALAEESNDLYSKDKLYPYLKGELGVKALDADTVSGKSKGNGNGKVDGTDGDDGDDDFKPSEITIHDLWGMPLVYIYKTSADPLNGGSRHPGVLLGSINNTVTTAPDAAGWYWKGTQEQITYINQTWKRKHHSIRAKRENATRNTTVAFGKGYVDSFQLWSRGPTGPEDTDNEHRIYGAGRSYFNVVIPDGVYDVADDITATVYK